MKQGRSWIFGIILIVFAAGLVLWGSWGIFSAKNISDTTRVVFPAGQARVVFDYGDDVLVDGQTAASGTILDVTVAVLIANNIVFDTKTYPGMGTLVTQIGDKKNGANGAYWQYWLNGVYATSSADRAYVRSDDRVEWKFSADGQ